MSSFDELLAEWNREFPEEMADARDWAVKAVAQLRKDVEQASKGLPLEEGVERYVSLPEPFPTIKNVKLVATLPDRPPASIMTDTCDGIYPCHEFEYRPIKGLSHISYDDALIALDTLNPIGRKKMQTITNRQYSCESLVDLESDIIADIIDANIPTDEYGFTAGIYHVVITYREEEEA